MPTNETNSTAIDSVVAEVRGAPTVRKLIVWNRAELASFHWTSATVSHTHFWTWMSPNLEFTTVYVGVIAVLFFGLTIWQGILAVAVGNLLGSVATRFLAQGDQPSVFLRWLCHVYHSDTAATFCRLA